MEMKKLFLLLLYCSFSMAGLGQPANDTSWKKIYRGSYPKINDLVHVKLNVTFNYDKTQMNGEAWISLKPHFYPTDSLSLDAKQMEIDRVALVKGNTLADLKYEYDGWHIRIRLGRIYNSSEQYTVYVKYISKPREAKLPEDRRGLYFINPKGDQKDMPTQIWTDGETENNSVWCPVIDKPDQKTTEEIIMTVPDKYVTLSNGKLDSQKKNADGSRTDHWKMDLPHAPYLFFLAVGDFAIVKDKFKSTDVDYYVEHVYETTARRVFGQTPAMMAFYENITGVPFPWVKYSQIVLRNLTITAMENTTTTAHGELAQQDARELIDGNRWENNIAHELFHHWFGDYVTCESWSNLTLNESFARYGEYLWQEHQYGADAAGEENYSQLRNYLNNPGNASKPLVRFYYNDAEDMFDDISYDKGGLILNLLRNVVGDSAFFKGLNLYLTTYKFKTAEAHQLRLAMEAVSGKDLNWFFNQWYFGSGHPKVTIDYLYDDSAKKVNVIITQTQGADHLFRVPLTIDIYNGTSKECHAVWLSHERDSFSFQYSSRPELVNVDADKIQIWDKTDNKTLENFIWQYDYAAKYVDRREAIAGCAKNQTNPLAMELLKKSLRDKYPGLREFTMRGLNLKNDTIRLAFEQIILDLAKNDDRSTVRALAIEILGNYNKKKYEDLFMASLNDSSYAVAGAGLNALAKVDSLTAFREAKRLSDQNSKWALSNVIVVTLTEFGGEDDFDLISAKYAALSFRIRIARNFGSYLSRVHNTGYLKKGADILVAQRESNPFFRSAIDKQVLGDLMLKKRAAGLTDQADYIQRKITAP
jgi:aminopeptidase N